MKEIKCYQVDSFTNELFTGNPAAVCFPEDELSPELMRQIAAENNLSETAFVIKKNNRFHIRWFTPTVEVALCGHATLAAAHVLFEHHPDWLVDSNEVVFQTMLRGDLIVQKSNAGYTLDFPADPPQPAEAPPALLEAIGGSPLEIWKGQTDFVLVFGHEDNIRAISPDFRLLYSVNVRGVSVTAPGNSVDFVSRFFAPGSGIDEDPVTGSAHTTLTPYWCKRLKKSQCVAHQLSVRGGELRCALSHDRVLLTGNAITYLSGTIRL